MLDRHLGTITEILNNEFAFGCHYINRFVSEIVVGRINGVFHKTRCTKVLTQSPGHVGSHCKSGDGTCGNDSGRIGGIGCAHDMGELEVSQDLDTFNKHKARGDGSESIPMIA